MLSKVAIMLGVYSLVQGIVNYIYSKKPRSTAADWSYQNKEICKKTCRSHIITAIVMLVIASILLIFKA